MIIFEHPLHQSRTPFLSQNLQGEFVGNLTAPLTVPPGQPGFDPTLGREGVLTAFYGNPRQVFLSFGARF